MKVLVLGSAVRDILVEGVDAQSMLARYNKMEVPAIHVHSGGGAVNVAANLQHMGIKTYLACSVGEDPEGEYLLREIQEYGIYSDWIEIHPELPTGKSVIFVAPSGEPTVFVERGASADLSLTRIDSLASMDCIYAASLAPQAFHVLDGLLQEAIPHNPDIKVVMNPGMRQLKNLLSVTDIIRLCDLLCINYEEGRVMEQTLGNSLSKSPEELIHSLYVEGCRAVLLTLGAKGALYYAGDEMVYVPAPRVKIVSALGAGDNFCSSFAMQWLQGVKPEQALAFANQRAQTILGLLGANYFYL